MQHPGAMYFLTLICIPRGFSVCARASHQCNFHVARTHVRTLAIHGAVLESLVSMRANETAAFYLVPKAFNWNDSYITSHHTSLKLFYLFYSTLQYVYKS